MNYRQQKIESTSWLLKEALAGYDVAATAPDDLELMGEDLIRQFRDILELGNRHHLLAVTDNNYDFFFGEGQLNRYLDEFVASAEQALNVFGSSQSSEDSRSKVEHLRACLAEARLCRFPNQDYADRPDVQASLARAQRDIDEGRLERL